VVVSHDRWFLERTCDVIYALLGDGTCLMLPGGVEEYLARRAVVREAGALAAAGKDRPAVSATTAAVQRQARKELARIEGQLAKLETRIADLHDQMTSHAADYEKLLGLNAALAQAQAEQADLESRWLELADAE